MYARSTIREQLGRLGLQAGDSVIVHAAYKATGGVDGGAEALIETLMEIVTADGALLIPNLNIPGEFTALNPPRFDIKRDPIRHMIGIVPEIFKFTYAEAWSIHPTHALMGVGDRAPGILAGHEKAGVSCGARTPWDRNARSGGKILLIGVNQHSNTTYHSAEEQMTDTYQLSKDIIEGVCIVDGREISVPSRLHVWCNHPDFNIINDELEQRDILKRGPVGDAASMLIDAGRFLDVCLGKLEQNPQYFLKKTGG